MNTNTTTTRRAVLAGTAAMPALALALPAAAEQDDPAIAAVRHWLEASNADRTYRAPDGCDWEDDPQAQALDAARNAAHWRMAQTVPTTAEGLALMLAACLFDQRSYQAGSRMDDPASWGDDAGD